MLAAVLSALRTKVRPGTYRLRNRTANFYVATFGNNIFSFSTFLLIPVVFLVPILPLFPSPTTTLSLANDLSEPDRVKVVYDACQCILICVFSLESLFLFTPLLPIYGQRVSIRLA
jgi:hypothetical protein